MSGSEEKKGNGTPPAGKPLIMLAIGMDPSTGQCVVNGPLENKPLCYEMLAKAATAIVEFDPAAQKSRLIGHADPLALRNLKGN